MQNYPISPRPLDQHPVVHIRVCTEDEFALDPLPSKIVSTIKIAKLLELLLF